MGIARRKSSIIHVSTGCGRENMKNKSRVQNKLHPKVMKNFWNAAHITL